VTSVRRKTARSSSPGRKKVGFREKEKGRGCVEENLGFFSSPFLGEIFFGDKGEKEGLAKRDQDWFEII
jgi:hypothetical protein